MQDTYITDGKKVTCLELVFTIELLLYLVFLTFVKAIWSRLPSECHSRDGEVPGVSIIIPARNEGPNIERLVQSLGQLVYPVHKLEIVIVDDASEDQTAIKLQQLTVHNPNITILTLNEPSAFKGSYKKRALTHGIQASQFPIIITSDADCQFNPLWVKSLVNALQYNNWVMASAPVIYQNRGSLVPMLNIELACLVAVGATSLHVGAPNMCNGANLVFTREAFTAVNGYQGYEHVPSGDDEFLLYKVYQQFPGRVGFVKSNEALVNTEPPLSWKELLDQRRRWGAKWKEHKSITTRLLALWVFLFHLTFIVILIMAIAGAYSWIVMLVQILLKMMFEFWLIKSLFDFFGKRISGKWFLIMQLLYSFYVVFVGVGAQFNRYSWKKRQYG